MLLTDKSQIVYDFFSSNTISPGDLLHVLLLQLQRINIYFWTFGQIFIFLYNENYSFSEPFLFNV